MLRIILITFGALFVLFCLIVCYCACVVAGQEDRRMEALEFRVCRIDRRKRLFSDPC